MTIIASRLKEVYQQCQNCGRASCLSLLVRAVGGN
jgi:hypothetical protein